MSQAQTALFPIRQKLVLAGHCPAKKNLWKIGKRGMYIDEGVRSEISWLTLQARQQWKHGTVEHPDLSVTFYVHNSGSDRDNKLTTVLDCLASAGVIKNDNINRFNGMVVIEPAVLVGNPANEKTEVYIEVG